MNPTTIPQFLILDTEDRRRELGWVIDTYCITHEQVLSDIMQSLHYERDALENLDKLGAEISAGRYGQERELSIAIAVSTVNLGRWIYEELARLGAYVHGYLPYYFEPNISIDGDLILAKLSAEDLELY
jgi:hypothetical protein